MVESNRIFEVLKEQLKAHSKSYSEVGDRLGITESGVKKALNNRTLTLDKIEMVCELMGMSLTEFLRICDRRVHRRFIDLNDEQEELLGKDFDSHF